MSQLRAGAGKACINPDPDMYPIPSSDKDLGEPEPLVQVEPYNDMSVRAIALDNGGDRAMILSFELGTPPPIPGLVKTLAEATGFPEQNFFITATHSHSGPRTTKNRTPDEQAFNRKYYALLEQRAIQACKAAADSLRPARYAYGETLSYVNTNRDLQTFGGYWLEGRNPAGYSDKTLALVKFVDEEGKLIAALLNHATHATCTYMMRDMDHKAKTSGNFTSIACEFVEDYYGGGAVALWTSGAAGDQNPLLSHGLQYDYPDGFTAAVPYPDGVGYMQMELMGRTHGADAVKGLEAITEYIQAMPITHVDNTVLLPCQKFKNGKPDSWSELRPGSQGPRPQSIPYGEVPPYNPPEMVPDPDNPARLNMKLLKLGHIAILFLNAEVYSLLGREIKEASPYKQTIIVSHCGKDKVEYIQNKASAHHTVLQHFSRVIPGSADELVVGCEKELFEKALLA